MQVRRYLACCAVERDNVQTACRPRDFRFPSRSVAPIGDVIEVIGEQRGVAIERQRRALVAELDCTTLGRLRILRDVARVIVKPPAEQAHDYVGRWFPLRASAVSIAPSVRNESAAWSLVSRVLRSARVCRFCRAPRDRRPLRSRPKHGSVSWGSGGVQMRRSLGQCRRIDPSSWRLPSLGAALIVFLATVLAVTVVGPVQSAFAVGPSGLQLPFAKGAVWRANGPHGDGASGTGIAYSVDFAPDSGGDGTVLAAAAGTARKSGTCSVDVDHPGGWTTRYQHLGTLTGTFPRPVNTGDPLGVTKANDPRGTTCNSGSYSHLHFGLLQNGTRIPISGLSIGGYTVHGTGQPYLGSWTRDIDGKTVVTVPASGNATCCITNSNATWRLVPSPNPVGASVNVLRDVACPAPTNCFGVGDSRSGPTLGTYKTLIEHWNGTSWSIVSNGRPAGSSYLGLHSVACPNANSCFAVGFEYISNVRKPFIDHWDGTSWSTMSSAVPTGVFSSELLDIACLSPTNCYAVGDAVKFTNTTATLIEHWNGTSWSVIASPNLPNNDQSFLNGIACPSTTTCFAVGDGSSTTSTANLTLIERWNGVHWSVVPSPSPPLPEFDSVACSTPTACFAIGSHYLNSNSTELLSLIERWNGTNWAVVPSPNPSTQGVFALRVACPTSLTCYGVGYYLTGPGLAQTLIAHWNGSSWSIVSSPNPTGSSFSDLLGVACSTATSCFAVGDSDYGTLVERLS